MSGGEGLSEVIVQSRVGSDRHFIEIKILIETTPPSPFYTNTAYFIPSIPSILQTRLWLLASSEL
jgi:hypothetical protein